jgi:CheY-like chemotaxis protein
VGIAVEDRDRIFEMFTQLDDSSTRSRGGTGLGLALCRQFSTLLQGTLSVTGEKGKGSTFTLRLPCEVSSEAPIVNYAMSGVSVLVVDDNKVNRMVLGRMLKRMGCEVEEVDNGARAVEAATHSKHAAIFMDCEMPIMDGFDATRLIRRELGSEVLIVATTAYVSEHDRSRCRDAGMDEFLAKPVSPDDIAGVLRRRLDLTASP